MSAAFAVHLLAAVVWIGGMLAMLLVVRPTAISLLEPPLRLRFMAEALGRFFPWVVAAVVVLPVTGYLLLFGVFGSMATSPTHIHLMQAIGWPMVAIFAWIRLRDYPRLRLALAEQNSALAAGALERIRKLVLLNSVLGVLLVALAGGGRYWG